MLRELGARVDELAEKNHQLEWTAISLCRRTMSLCHRIGDREDQRHIPYLRARGYGSVIRPQMGRRTGTPGLKRPVIDTSNVDLPDYQSDE